MQKTVAETAANAPDFPADPAESGYNPVLYSTKTSWKTECYSYKHGKIY